MNKDYVDFKSLHRNQIDDVFFVTRTKSSLKYELIEQNFDIDQNTGLRVDKTIVLSVAKSKRF